MSRTKEDCGDGFNKEILGRLSKWSDLNEVAEASGLRIECPDVLKASQFRRS